MIRLANDSDHLAALLPTDIVMPYADLLTPDTLAELIGRMPDSEIVPIDRGLGDPMNLATIIDVERGAHTPANVAPWVHAKHGQGFRYLTVYASQDTMPDVDHYMHGRGGWWRFYASWRDGLAVPEHPAALIQFIDGATLKAPVDLSLVHNDKWHPRRLPTGHQAELRAIARLLGHVGYHADRLGRLADGGDL